MTSGKAEAVWADKALIQAWREVMYEHRAALADVDRGWPYRHDLPAEMKGEDVEVRLPLPDGRVYVALRSVRWPTIEEAVAELVHDKKIPTLITEAMIVRRVQDRLVSAQRKSPEFEYHRRTPAELATAARFDPSDARSRVTRRRTLEPPRRGGNEWSHWRDPTGDRAVANLEMCRVVEKLPDAEVTIWRAERAFRRLKQEQLRILLERYGVATIFPAALSVPFDRLLELSLDGPHEDPAKAMRHVFRGLWSARDIKRLRASARALIERADYLVSEYGDGPIEGPNDSRDDESGL
jgi:hypothetical protein